MELSPKLIDVRVPKEPEGAVLVLHGGASRREHAMVSPTQLSVLRMIPIAKAIGRAGRGDLAVFRVLNSSRGWDTRHTPVDDARWALAQLRERFGEVPPVCLVGHSLGGRAALLTLGAPEVRSAVALAPWVYPDDVPRGLDGQPVLFVHGDADRIASPARASALARAMASRARVGYVSVRGGKHAMLNRSRTFTSLAASFAVATLLDKSQPGPVDRVLRGEAWITV